MAADAQAAGADFALDLERSPGLVFAFFVPLLLPNPDKIRGG